MQVVAIEFVTGKHYPPLLLKPSEIQMLYNTRKGGNVTVNQERLGKVYTPSHIADFMCHLLHVKGKNARVLDPCAGRLAFANAISRISPRAGNGIVNVELEGNKSGFEPTDFFDYPVSEKFDYIIMNPPYVRQELLSKPGVNNKESIRERLNRIDPSLASIPKTSNLYVYFFAKCYHHLNEGGRLVAICYDSWLYTQFGAFFKIFLSERFTVKRIVHFKTHAFDGVSVGATVLELEKRQSISRPDFHEIENADVLTDCMNYTKFLCETRVCSMPMGLDRPRRKCGIMLESSFFSPIKELTTGHIRRGTSAIANGFFLFKQKEERFKKYLVPILKDVTRVKKFSAGLHEADYLLCPKSESTDNGLRCYLKQVEKSVLSTPLKFGNLKKRIRKGERWYFVKRVSPGKIIFNYYIRGDPSFILNPNGLDASDNFYLFDAKDEYVMLSILNSSFTNNAIKTNSRSQGNGLLKMQLYEFKDLPVPNPRNFDLRTLHSLRNLGKKLSVTSREKRRRIVQEVDNILLREYNTVAGERLTANELK